MSDWMQIRILLPPDVAERERNRLDDLVALYGFKVHDWCEWRSPSGATMDIAPCPPPADQEDTDE